MKVPYIIIVILVIIIGFGLDHLVFLMDTIKEQETEITQLSVKVSSLEKESDAYLIETGSLNEKIQALDTKTKKYLEAENMQCNKDTETCLYELTMLLNPSKPECSPLADNICPPECAAGVDYDCCIAGGFRWVPGSGCYR